MSFLSTIKALSLTTISVKATLSFSKDIDFVKLSDKPYSYSELKEIVDEILEKAHTDSKTYLESDKEGSFVVQSREYRISIAYPPFAEESA